MFGLIPLKTQAFLCFQSSHMPRMAIVLNPFLLSLGTCLAAFLHQPAKSLELAPGTHLSKPIGSELEIICKDTRG
jgi:hypothetical protein